QTKDLDPARVGTDAARYFYAYAAALLAAGRRDDAITWFMNAASADDDDVTDAEDRLMELAEPDSAADEPDADPELLAPVHADAPKAVSEVSAPPAVKEVPEQVVPQLVPAAPV